MNTPSENIVLCVSDPTVAASDIPEYWFSKFHSGSEAMELAREFLLRQRSIGNGIGDYELALICSELLLRVTGERIAPSGIDIDVNHGFATDPMGNEWHV